MTRRHQFARCLLFSAAVLMVGPAWSVDMGIEVDAADLPVNVLSVRSDSADVLPFVAVEASGILVENSIALRIPSGLTFSELGVPEGWVFQTAIVELPEGKTETVVTYHYRGTVEADPNEAFGFSEPWRVRFRIGPDPEDEDSGMQSAPLQVSLRATAFLPGSGPVAFTAERSLAMITLREGSAAAGFGYEIAGLDEDGVTLRLGEVLPIFLYCIDASADLVTWRARRVLQPTVGDSNVFLRLPHTGLTQEFFRVVIRPVLGAESPEQ